MSGERADFTAIMSLANFVIVSYPRTASTFLTLKLHSCSQLICYSELFHKSEDAFSKSFYDDDFKLVKATWLGKKELNLAKLFRLRNKDFRKFLELVFCSPAIPVGFKIFPGQNDKAMRYLIKDKRLKKIFLIRDDMLRNFVSHKIAVKTGQWGRAPGQKADLQRVEVGVKEFLIYAGSKLDSLKALENQCNADGQETLRLTCEGITADFPVDDIGEFLGVDLGDIQQEVALQKQNPFSLKEMVTNYEELMTALEGTPWKRSLTGEA